ncbi:MAG: PKD domain-containing protein [Catenulispora sp.]|nr:PKD domain-containing protein [Catenulispora sp.]
MAPFPAHASASAKTPAAPRYGGTDRIATALQIADAHFGPSNRADIVVLTRDDAFADALAGNALAAQHNGPLLVTPTANLAPNVAAELTKVLPPHATVYLLGGEQALSTAVQNQVAGLGFTPVRLAGSDRYDTATKIAAAIAPRPHTILLATGDNAPDALAAGAAAATDPSGGVVLLTHDTAVPPSTGRYLAGVDPSATNVYAVGGQAVAALGSQPRFAGRFTALAGADRFETDAKVAANTKLYPNPATAGLATGDDGHWPDALAGGAFLGVDHAPLLLASAGAVPPPVLAWFRAHAGNLSRIAVFGGRSALPQAAVDQALAAATGVEPPPVVSPPPPGGNPPPGATPPPGVTAPTAALATGLPHGAAAIGQPVTFDASQSKPGSSPIASYAFDFGDGITQTTDKPTASHAYTQPGQFTATVRVTDTDGGSATASAGVYVAAPPPPPPPPPPAHGNGPGTPVGATGLVAWAGLYDDHHTSGTTGTKPSPWCSSPNVVPYPQLANGGTAAPNAIVFEGDSDDGAVCGSGWDTPGIMVANTGGATRTVTITVSIAATAATVTTPPQPGQTAGNKGRDWDLWQPVVLQPGQSVIFAQRYVGGSLQANSFDPGDTNYAGAYGAPGYLCPYPSPAKAVVHVVVDGAGIDLTDAQQTLNTHGVDAAGCTGGVGSSGRNDESEPWTAL